MKLRELIDRTRLIDARDISVRDMDGDGPDVRDVVYDSRKVARDRAAIFTCVPGAHTDGIKFATQAYENGACAILCEHEIDVPIPQIVTSDVRSYMGCTASALYGNPSDHMVMIGLTGTNGKTTTAYMIRSILREFGKKVGMLGTIVYDDAAAETYADRTTPEGPDIQRYLNAMMKNGAAYCVMETSSHGLHQGRLAGCRFDRVGFSNLTNEHLDYHSSMEEYFKAKRLLFAHCCKSQWLGRANADDGYGVRLIDEFPDRCGGFSTASSNSCYDRASIVERSIDGMTASFTSALGDHAVVKTPFIGTHDLANMIEAVSIVASLGYDFSDAARALERCDHVPGRLERVKLDNGVGAFVDYAHTPDGIEKVLLSLRPLTTGRLIIVWGAGGDRSKDKRPLAGSVMARHADLAIITEDNPRSEDPAEIAKDIERGAKEHSGARYEIILNRKEAIFHALDIAKPGDTVVVAGKGPERYIEYADRRVPFSDTGTIKEWAAQNGCLEKSS